MIEETATSITAFLEVIEKYHNDGWIYRGVSDSSYGLIPKIGRKEFAERYTIYNERYLLQLFKERAIRHITYSPKSDFEWLALGQHHGLPTRLLDWSYSPLVPLYFSVSRRNLSDGAVYCRHMERANIKFETLDPFSMREPIKYYPPHISPRIPAQHALFTIEPDPLRQSDIPKLVKIIIPASNKYSILVKLSLLGFHEESMFPDLDGACRHAAWRFENGQGYWEDRK